MTEVKQHKATGLWYPKGEGTVAISEAYNMGDYGGLPSVIDFKDKVVMDCGAHLGAFSARALAEGAKFVHCFEPNADSFRGCLSKNLEEDRHEVTKAALIAGDEESMEFHYREDRLISGTLYKRHCHNRYNYKTVVVPTVNFYSEVERIRPDIIKMDIEGAEWDVLTKPIPDFVKGFFFEFHISKKPGRSKEDAYERILQVFPGGEFKEQHDSVVFGRVLNVTGAIAR